MRAYSKSFLRNLDEAVLEHRRITCPNVDCEDVIVSKEVIQSPNHSTLEYNCPNTECCYHSKRKILISRPKQVSDEFDNANSIASQGNKKGWVSSLFGLLS